jgi:hypothetical protein
MSDLESDPEVGSVQVARAEIATLSLRGPNSRRWREHTTRWFNKAAIPTY